jgi:hypothetical protein
MTIELQGVLIFFHVLLFGYWLGADLGVFFCDSQLTRDDLSLDERLRVRRIRRKIDLAPRTCVPLILPLGFTMAVPWGSPVDGGWLVLIWILSLAWLVLLWSERLTADKPIGKTIHKLDRIAWYSVAVVTLGLGLYSLATGAPFAERWISVKVLLYGFMVLSAVWITAAADRWPPIFAMVRAGGNQAVEGERLMKRNRVNCGSAAGTLWAIVLLIAFVGATKPF